MGLVNIFTRSYFMSSLMSLTSFQGSVIISGSVTLTSHLFCNSLFVPLGSTLYTKGWGIYCAGQIENRGLIHCNASHGANGTVDAEGAGGETIGLGVLQQGAPGAMGGFDGMNGESIPHIDHLFGGYGGRGGNAGVFTGGLSSDFTVCEFIASEMVGWQQQFSPYAIKSSLGSYLVTGGGGGGGAADIGAGGGGGGGEGGHMVFIAASRIVNTGQIEARGGNGGNGYDDGVHATGGGGAGSGGIIILCTNFLTPGTLTVQNGIPGTGYNGGGNGIYGSSGTIFRLNLP